MREWVIVGNPGQDNWYIHSEHDTYKSASMELEREFKFARELEWEFRGFCEGEEEKLDIMRRLPSGTLTMEF